MGSQNLNPSRQVYRWQGSLSLKSASSALLTGPQIIWEHLGSPRSIKLSPSNQNPPKSGRRSMTGDQPRRRVKPSGCLWKKPLLHARNSNGQTTMVPTVVIQIVNSVVRMDGVRPTYAGVTCRAE